MIKHVSFDVWNTLLYPNPKFMVERDRFLSEVFDVTPAEARDKYKKVKTKLDQDSEQKGVGLYSREVYRQLFEEFTLGTISFSDSWWIVRAGLEAITRAYPPIMEPEVGVALRKLQRGGFSLSIASNTNFIRGKILKEVILDHVGVVWSFQMFSDELGYAKPSRDLWKALLSNAKTSVHRNIQPKHILHVGDNRICDGECITHAIQYQYVANPSQLNKVLERFN